MLSIVWNHARAACWRWLVRVRQYPTIRADSSGNQIARLRFGRCCSFHITRCRYTVNEIPTRIRQTYFRKARCKKKRRIRLHFILYRSTPFRYALNILFIYHSFFFLNSTQLLHLPSIKVSPYFSVYNCDCNFALATHERIQRVAAINHNARCIQLCIFISNICDAAHNVMIN